MEDSISLHEEWSTGQKIRFRFISIFFFLFIFPFPLWFIPGLPSWMLEWYYTGYDALVRWTGAGIFGIEGEMVAYGYGSGDNTYSWIQNFVVLMVALIGGTLWSVLDRKRPSYQTLWRWFHLLVTYFVAFYMFSYGLGKVFGDQFGYPKIERMLETYGESSPMRLMWTFMSASEAYERFSGWSEAIAGFLILFRRTRTLGGLAVAGVMLNVFMMNMTYDVPVKLLSSRLMLMGIYIALADYKRLLSIFITNEPTQRVEWPPLFTTRWKKYLTLGILVLLAGFSIYSPIQRGIGEERDFGPDRPRPALYGIHDVELFVINGDTLPPLTTDTLRWSKAYMDLPGWGGDLTWNIKGMDNTNLKRYIAELDSMDQIMNLKKYGDTVNVYPLKYSFTDGNLSLSGILEGDTLHIETEYFNPDDFLLVSRGFHWISERPYNVGQPYRKK